MNSIPVFDIAEWVCRNGRPAVPGKASSRSKDGSISDRKLAIYQAHEHGHSASYRGVAGDNLDLPLPSSPTDALPGSLEKMRVMAERLAAGCHLHHPLDADGGSEEKGAGRTDLEV